MNDTPLTKIPRHVTLIMDGNGRWAKQRGLDRVAGHFEGVESFRAVMEAGVEMGIEYISVFAFSEENWGRPEAEVKALMSLLLRVMKKEVNVMLENHVHFTVIGNRARLSDEINKAIDEIDALTAPGAKMTMIVFISYSGKWDLQQAARRMAEAGDDNLEPYLATAGIPDPDLMIRTSGEMRISNYMLWQLAYTELYFTDVLWPDFRKEQFRLAIQEYASRDRRFGKLK